jgi:hypothetical protein
MNSDNNQGPGIISLETHSVDHSALDLEFPTSHGGSAAEPTALPPALETPAARYTELAVPRQTYIQSDSHQTLTEQQRRSSGALLVPANDSNRTSTKIIEEAESKCIKARRCCGDFKIGAYVVSVISLVLAFNPGHCRVRSSRTRFRRRPRDTPLQQDIRLPCHAGNIRRNLCNLSQIADWDQSVRCALHDRFIGSCSSCHVRADC